MKKTSKINLESVRKMALNYVKHLQARKIRVKSKQPLHRLKTGS